MANSGTTSGEASAPVLGVIGGSGLYDWDGLTDVGERAVETPFGAPSGPVVTGTLAGGRIAFLSRHGRGHLLSPSEINYRANVHALKQLGVTRLLSVSAVGSLREGIAPGDLVLPDQVIDKTYRRESTFFGDGVVGHVSFADPVCAPFVAAVARAAVDTGCTPADRGDRGRPAPLSSSSAGARATRLHGGGTYVCMEGPQFSTRAESLLHRAWGADVIGMTAATEAKLAREAELCFGVLALCTDYDCWHPGEDAVTAQSVVEVLRANIARARAVVESFVDAFARTQGTRPAPAPWSCHCASAAENAILTAREAVTPEAKSRLRNLYGRYL